MRDGESAANLEALLLRRLQAVLQGPRSGTWYIVYHRRPLGEKDRNSRVVCIDELRFNDDGTIAAAEITGPGVLRDPVR